MLEIRKIGENLWLVNGEYFTNDYSKAVVIANKGKKIKGFSIKISKKISIWRNLKNKFNFPFLLLESWMWNNEKDWTYR